MWPPIRRRRLPRECTETQNTHNSLSLALSQRHRHHGMRDGVGNQTNSTRRLKKQQTRKRFSFSRLSFGRRNQSYSGSDKSKKSRHVALLYICNLVFGKDEAKEHPAAHKLRFKTTRNTSKKGKKNKKWEREKCACWTDRDERLGWPGDARDLSSGFGPFRIRKETYTDAERNMRKIAVCWICADAGSRTRIPSFFLSIPVPHIIASKESTGGTFFFFFFSNRASDNQSCVPPRQKKIKEALKHVSEAS